MFYQREISFGPFQIVSQGHFCVQTFRSQVHKLFCDLALTYDLCPNGVLFLSYHTSHAARFDCEGNMGSQLH